MGSALTSKPFGTRPQQLGFQGEPFLVSGVPKHFLHSARLQDLQATFFAPSAMDIIMKPSGASGTLKSENLQVDDCEVAPLYQRILWIPSHHGKGIL